MVATGQLWHHASKSLMHGGLGMQIVGKQLRPRLTVLGLDQGNPSFIARRLYP
jgi:hypothetical protein